VDAVYAFAYALHNLHNDRCNTQSDQTSEQRKHQHSESVWYRKLSTDSKSQACPDMANYDGKDFYNNYLLNVSFIGWVLPFCFNTYARRSYVSMLQVDGSVSDPIKYIYS